VLRKTDGQQTFAAIEGWCSHLLDEHTFYAKLNRYGGTWFRDEDFAEMYKSGGRPSVPPSLLAMCLLLQMYMNVSDRELVSRIRFDLRVKYALNLPIDHAGFDSSLLSHFRSRLVKHKKEEQAFKRTLEFARTVGFIESGESQATDSAPILGAAAVQDTWTLIRTGIEKLLRSLEPFEIQGFVMPFGKEKYLKNPGKPNIDWNDKTQKYGYLKDLVGDARLLLEAVQEPTEEMPGPAAQRIVAGDSAVQHGRALLHRILEQDIDDRPDGPSIRKGKVATKNRVISTNDPSMRHGHKTTNHLFAGYKSAITVTLGTELVTSVDVIAANAHDATPLVGQLKFLKSVGIFPLVIYADCAYGGADTRVNVRNEGSEIKAKVPATSNSSKHFTKDQFKVDIRDNVPERVTCPAGQSTTRFRQGKDDHGRTAQIACFGTEQCAGCNLREKCTPLRRKGRELQLHHHEDTLQSARLQAAMPGFRQDMKKRLVVERVNSRLKSYGLGMGRYFGTKKTRLQALMAATVNNFWRITTLMKSAAPAGA
jgi:hypothetical protein